MPKTIALVEDDQLLRENYAEAFIKHGYAVNTYSNRLEAIAAFRQSLPDLAILDIMLMPEMDGGFTLCTELRQLSKTLPIIFLTALDSEYDKISGRRVGGWDYLTKDSSLHLIIACIDNTLRVVDAFSQPPENEQDMPRKLIVGPLEMDIKSWLIYWHGQRIDLSMTEFSILHNLAKHPGQVCTHDNLMQFTKQKVVTDNTISTHIRRIRSKFRQADADFDCIRSAHGVGYRWQYNDE